MAKLKKAVTRPKISPRFESSQHVGLPPQRQEQHPGTQASDAEAAGAPAACDPDLKTNHPPVADPAVVIADPTVPLADPTVLIAAASPRDRLRKRGQLTPRDGAMSARGSGQLAKQALEVSTDQPPQLMINFRLQGPKQEAGSGRELLEGTTWQLTSLVEELPSKLTQLLRLRHFKPSKTERRPRIGDVVRIRDSQRVRELARGSRELQQAVGQPARIVKDDRDKDPYIVRLVSDDNPFGRQASEVPKYLRPADLELLEESRPSFELVWPSCCSSPHAVAQLQVDEDFVAACDKLNRLLQAAADDGQRLKAQNEFLQAVVRFGSYWLPFDAGAFTSEARDDEVVAPETRLLRALETDVTLFPAGGNFAATELRLSLAASHPLVEPGALELTLTLRFRRCLLCRADAFAKFPHPFIAPRGMGVVGGQGDTHASKSSWERVAPESGGYASLEYGRDHPCFETGPHGSCVHRLRIDNSDAAVAVFVELRERERKDPAEAYRALKGADAPSALSQLTDAQRALTHPRFLTGAEPRPAPGYPAGAVVFYEVRVHAPAQGVDVEHLNEQVSYTAGKRLLFLSGDRLVDGTVRGSVTRV